MTWSLPFKLSFQRKAPSLKDNRYPLSLSGTEINSLKELLRSQGWPTFRKLLERYGELRAQRLLTPLPPDATNVERGAIAAIFEIAALPDQLVKHIGEYDARRTNTDGANDNADDPAFYLGWGSEYFRDTFRHP